MMAMLPAWLPYANALMKDDCRLRAELQPLHPRLHHVNGIVTSTETKTAERAKRTCRHDRAHRRRSCVSFPALARR